MQPALDDVASSSRGEGAGPKPAFQRPVEDSPGPGALGSGIWPRWDPADAAEEDSFSPGKTEVRPTSVMGSPEGGTHLGGGEFWGEVLSYPGFDLSTCV